MMDVGLSGTPIGTGDGQMLKYIQAPRVEGRPAWDQMDENGNVVELLGDGSNPKRLPLVVPASSGTPALGLGFRIW